jgi:hypothetical protein
MTANIPGTILIIVGILAVLTVAVFAVLTLLAAAGLKDDTQFLDKAEKRSARHTDKQ